MQTEIQITNNRTLKMLNDAGLVIWPCMINNSTGIKFKYVDTVNDAYSFTHKKVQYVLRFHPGCFMPFVYAKVKPALIKQDGIIIKQSH